MLKIFLRAIIDICKLFYGLTIYKLLQHTPELSYQAFIRVFCVSNGKCNDFLSYLISLKDKKKSISIRDSIFCDNYIYTDTKHYTDSLNENGFYLFDFKLPKFIALEISNRPTTEE